jgi:hypothetical protein
VYSTATRSRSEWKMSSVMSTEVAFALSSLVSSCRGVSVVGRRSATGAERAREAGDRRSRSEPTDAHRENPADQRRRELPDSRARDPGRIEWWIASCLPACSWNTTGATKRGSRTFAPLAPTTRRGRIPTVEALPRGVSMRLRARRQSASTRGIVSSETSATLPPAPTARSAVRAIPPSRARTSTKRRASRTSASGSHAHRSGSLDLAREDIIERRPG